MRHNRDGEQKSYNLFGLFSLFILLGISSLYGGSFEDFKKAQSTSYQSFREEKDAEFSQYMKQQWQEFEALYSPALYEKPKPKTIPSSATAPIKPVGPKITITIPPSPTQPKYNTQPLEHKDISFSFFGAKIGFNIDDALKKARFYPTNQKGIVDFFTIMASSNYSALIADIKSYADELVLNDWGVYLLIKQLSEHIYDNRDEQRLFTWFVLNKLSYDVKIALSHKHTLLLHKTKQMVYAAPNYTLNHQKYFLLGNYDANSIHRIFTYEQNYPQADKALDFKIEELPHFPYEPLNKEVQFTQNKKTYTFHYMLNENLIAFMKTYPQVDYEIYFNTPLSSQTYTTLAQDMKRYLNGKKASEAMNFVLHFVQKAFAYETDRQHFGKEKVMFAEETLYYDKSDCEDRAVLFARLVKRLFGVGVVGVKYSNHMATALYIPLKGDSVRIGHKKFIIADPTYINANIGKSMPQYKSIQPEEFIYLSSK